MILDNRAFNGKDSFDLSFFFLLSLIELITHILMT